jgi:hypothetical protein
VRFREYAGDVLGFKNEGKYWLNIRFKGRLNIMIISLNSSRSFAKTTNIQDRITDGPNRVSNRSIIFFRYT